MWKIRSFLYSGPPPFGSVSQSCSCTPSFIVVSTEVVVRRKQCWLITISLSTSCPSCALVSPRSIVTCPGRFATSEETAYPIQLARDVAECLIQALAGMKLPPSQLQDMTSSSEAVLQAVRKQSGIQPKHSKLPPLVPEFTTIIAVEVSSDTSSSQPPHSQIPQHCKFLSSAPLVTAPVNGGGTCEEEFLSAVPLRIPPMTGSFRSGECITPWKRLSRKQHRQDIRNLLRRVFQKC